MNANAVLSTLCDVEHVLGSFAGDCEGQLLASAMPGYFSAGDLEAAAGRIAGLFLCAKEAEVNGQSALLNFGEHLLFVSRFERGHLCVLSEAGINLASLRMAARLVARRLPASIDASQSRSVPEDRDAEVGSPAKGDEPTQEDTLVSGRATEPPSLPAASQPPSEGRTIVYRGRRFQV